MGDKSKAGTAPRPRRGGVFRRLLWTVLVLALGAGGLYAASWLNARRLYLIVGPTEVTTEKGRMLPMGHEPFVPQDVELRRAYQSFPLPGGIKVPRGETVFSDRVELDQAIFRLLKDAIGYALSEDSRRTPELVQRYLRQIKAIPGTSVSQQLELADLERDAQYVEARQRLDDGFTALKDAAQLFRQSVRGQGGRNRDGELRAQLIERALDRLSRLEIDPLHGVAGSSESRHAGSKSDARTSTVASSTTSAQQRAD